MSSFFFEFQSFICVKISQVIFGGKIMHKAIPGHFSGICIIMLCLLSCHGDPAIPDTQFNSDPLPAQIRTAGQSHHCFGYYSLMVDTGSMEIKTLPLRSAELHLNLTGVLNSTMGVTAKGVPGEHDPPNGIFTFDVTLTHPFPLKSNLAGFDVKGILISPGSLTINNLIFGNTLLLNGDGYSRWWNPTGFTEAGMFGYEHGYLANQPPYILNAQVNPYKYFADILDATTDLSELYSVPLDDDQGRGVFSAGASNTRRYRIQFPLDPGPEIRYGYAIDASWAAPSPNPPSEIPDDFPIEANQPEPYIVDLKVTKNSLFYDTESGNSGGVLRLMTTIHDWQGQLNGNTYPEASSVKVYCPNLYSGGIDFSMGGTVGDAAIFLHDLTGIAQPPWSWDYTLAVEVISSDGTTYDQGLGYPAPSDAVAAWDTTTVSIVDPPCEADSNNDFDSAADIGMKDSVIDYLCEGVDNVDYYKLQVPYGEEVTVGKLYACSNVAYFNLALYDDNYNVIAEDGSSQELEIDLSPLDLDSGTYYISVSTSGTNGNAATYFLETVFFTESLPPLDPTDISTGFLDLEAEWVKIHGDYLYMAGDTGIWVYDVSDMANPVPVYRSYESVKGDPAFLYPHMYFLSDDTPPDLHYINFYDPTQPVNFGEIIAFSSYLDLITMSDEYLYFYKGETDWVYIYAYETNPAYPAHVVNFSAFNGVRKMDCLCPFGTYTSILMMSSDVFTMYNVEDPYNVEQTGFELLYNTMNRDFDIYGDAIVKVHTTINPTSNKLRTYNIKYDYTLDYKGYVDLPEKPEYVAAIVPYTQVTGADTYKIFTVNIMDPVNPVLVSTYTNNDEFGGLDGITNELYTLKKYKGLTVFDISDEMPGLVGSVNCLNYPVLGRISDDIGYFYDHNDDYQSFKTVDFSDPANPEIIDIFPLVSGKK